MNPLKQLHKLGQSIWLDFFDREVMDSGQLQKWIDEDDLAGITSNPSIFESAVASGSDYDGDIKKLADSGKTGEEIFFGFAVKDIQRAADILRPVYDAAKGNDGFVSLEVSPFLANDTEGTVAQALHLWKEVNRENVMIKIPGTKEGLEAIRQATAAGVNVNVTLLFGLDRYRAVTDAYLKGLEDRVARGESIDGIKSVASFFLSRIDVLLDPQLKAKGLTDLAGKAAIASAKTAYQIYKEVFGSDRFKKLEEKGARKQKVLWASTGTKNPEYSDVLYVETLIGENTINTLPVKTIDAFRDHGIAKSTLEEGMDKVKAQLEELAANGIDLGKVSDELEKEGIEKFNVAFEKLLSAIKEKAGKVKVS
ncbi:MAG: transaldolase [Chitinophagaceae bacterium]|nr:transaldolase [Chitinophagaceae bacterium]